MFEGRSGSEAADGDGDGEACFVVKLRGLPFSTTERDVVEFMEGASVVGRERGVHLTEVRPGRPSGECFVELETSDDVVAACKKNKEHMGPRYIEVFRSSAQEMRWALDHSYVANGQGRAPSQGGGRFPVRLRGLPFGCSKSEVLDFFQGLPATADGVMLLSDRTGRRTGEAFVFFADEQSAERALEKDREKIGHRYIEIFRSSPQEVYQCLAAAEGGGGGGGGVAPGPRPSRPRPYDRFDGHVGNGDRMRPPPLRGFRNGGRYSGGGRPLGRGDFRGNDGPAPLGDYDDGGAPPHWRGGNAGGIGPWRHGGDGDRGNGGGHRVHMRGLPFKATPNDVAYFFKPIRPLDINILYDNNNRPSGEADVEFECHEDALRAMRKDKSTMEHRYIELFLNSNPGGGGGRGGFGRPPRQMMY